MQAFGIELGSGGVVGGALVGIGGGVVSGLLGVSPGGILVPGLALGLGLAQHEAQALSLVAQLLPTSWIGVAHYRARGHDAPWRWVAWIALGFAAGAALGALGAQRIADRALALTYVAYLLLLAAVSMRRRDSGESRRPADEPARSAPVAALIVVGIVSGATAGLLGIGGGLAMTALMVGLLHRSQHQAQALSLAVTMLPLGLPAVWVYAREGTPIRWLAALGVIVGLVIGTAIGARVATRLPEARLRRWFLALVLGLAAAMAWRALARG